MTNTIVISMQVDRHYVLQQIADKEQRSVANVVRSLAQAGAPLLYPGRIEIVNAFNPGQQGRRRKGQ